LGTGRSSKNDSNDALSPASSSRRSTSAAWGPLIVSWSENSPRVAVRSLDRRWVRCVLLVVTTSAGIAILFAPRHAIGAVGLVLASGAAGGAVVYLEHHSPRLGLAPIAVAIGVVVLASIVIPPRTSNDLWSYTMYGRTVTVHGASPYDHVPADFRSDPFLHRVSPRWRHRGSVYGPLFVGVAAVGTILAGDSPLMSRLYFQILAALALAAILVVVWRTTRRVAALAFLGLNPVLAVIAVNGGHNDVFVGLAILVAALLASKRRGVAVGIVIGLAALIKLTAGLALIGVLLWAVRQHLRRFATCTVIAAASVVLLGYLPVLPSASHVLGEADKTVTNASLWNPLVDRLLHHDAWRNVANPLASNDTLTVVFYSSAALVLLLGLALGWLAGADRRAHAAVGTTVAAYPIAAQYSLPWYAAWALPAFAIELTPVAAVVWLQSVIALAALKLPLPVVGDAVHSTLRVVLMQIAPPTLLVAFVVSAIRRYRATKAPAPMVSAPAR
jgi:alpha-1,6-mannosyltransferase